MQKYIAVPIEKYERISHALNVLVKMSEEESVDTNRGTLEECAAQDDENEWKIIRDLFDEYASKPVTMSELAA